ncbi:MAG: pyrrolo-quinoline quinone, partial [Gammaproteobacteria bacterium]
MRGNCHSLTRGWLIVLPVLLAACGGGNSSTPGMPGSGGHPPPSSGRANVLTYHNDNARDGLNDQETVLTPANVNSTDFGKIAFFPMDGKVDAQPLYVSALNVNGATHNVVFAASEHDSVYAFDADSGQVLWQVSLLGAGETPSDDRGCNQVSPEIGVT